MITKSRKAKGRRLQNFVRDKILKVFKHLKKEDVQVALMSQQGPDIKLSRIAKRLVPYQFECKNQEKINIWESLNQAEENSGDSTPVLIFKRNRSKTYAVLEIKDFINLIK